MTNIFEMLKNYKDDSKEHTYASISDPQFALRENLSNVEFIIYNQIKQSDKSRLIKSGQIQENGH